MIYRTWGCQACDIEFTTGDEEPDCLKCHGEVQWVPAAGHGGILSGATRASDHYFKTQAAKHGLTNLHSARTGEAMAPRQPSAPRQTQPIQVAPGISVPILHDSQGQPISGVQNFVPPKGMQPAFGQGMPVNKPVPLRAMTQVTGRYDGK